MEKYDILLNEIKEYLNKEEVNGENFKNEIISLYDLYSAVKYEINGVEKISNNYKLEKLFKKYIFWKNFLCSDVGVKIGMQNKISYIHFRYKDTDSHSLYIQKDKNSQNIYLTEDTSKEKVILKFVKKYYDLILDTLIQYERYREVIANSEYFYSIEVEFKDDLFKIEMGHNRHGEINLRIKINDNHPLSSEYQKNYLKKENISDFVEKHKEEILKRFIIQPSQLTGEYKKIYNIHKNNLSEKGKVKSIKR